MFEVIVGTILVVSTVAALVWWLTCHERNRPRGYWCPRDCDYVVHLRGTMTAHPRCPVHHCDLVGE